MPAVARRDADATAIAAATTADAAHAVAERGDPGEVAIASERAGAAYGLTVLAGDAGDHAEAYTRFVAVAPYTRLDHSAESWRTAFSFVTAHRTGALHHAIEPFARHDLDLDQLVSRPIPSTPWRYRSTPCSRATRSTRSFARRLPR